MLADTGIDARATGERVVTAVGLLGLAHGGADLTGGGVDLAAVAADPEHFLLVEATFGRLRDLQGRGGVDETLLRGLGFERDDPTVFERDETGEITHMDGN